MLSDNHPLTGKNVQAEKETAGENVATPAPPPGDAENPVNETRVGISAREGFAVGVEDASAGVSAESVMKPFVAPIVKSVVKPVVDPVAGTVVRPIVDTVVEPVVEPVLEPVVEAVVGPIVEPVVGPIVEFVVDRAVESSIQRVAEPVVKPVVELVIEPAVDPVVEPVDEPVADAVTKTATNSDDVADNGLPAPITGVKTVSAVVRPIDDSVAEGVVESVAEGPVPGEELGVGVADDGWMGGWFGGVISHVRDAVDIAASSSIVQAALDVTEAAIGTSSPVASAVEGIPEPAKGSARVAAVAGAVFNTVVDWTGHRVEEAVLLVHHAADFSVSSMRTLWAFLAVCCARKECYAGKYFPFSLFREFVSWFELFA